MLRSLNIVLFVLYGALFVSIRSFEMPDLYELFSSLEIPEDDPDKPDVAWPNRFEMALSTNDVGLNLTERILYVRLLIFVQFKY